MAILAIVQGPGLTQELYESLRAPVAWERDQPAGGILHAAAFDENGDCRVVDVWESAEQMQQFFEQRLMPVLQQRNTPAPEVTIYPLHNLNLFAGSEKYRL